ncbi:aldo/keto reductase [Marinovum sp. 2_MG-2023]|uniref:aldo/keto reductase n=1 Tax=unclassified Marinovum TaxID=2647166 RepID=UPI0026E1E49E|nr:MULTISPECIES: aldo/keto reductase [unclassified Marinovum]MDO6732832.1 aldo/keto reductase [Marinovum sp. 2_MG-2023]MDO6782104.1 aldo/keto reductase [Marinovum sp. 1_MG-2023]
MSITHIGPAKIPSMGFGTFQLEQDTVADMVAAALSEGFRHIDTAQAYENEEQVGEGLRRADVRRDEVFLTNKILPEHFSPEAFIAAAETSLKRLGTDYVDLLLLHWPSKDVPIADTIGALNDLIAAGKVRHGGVSNFTMDMVNQAQAALNTPLAANQIELHPLIDQTGMVDFLANKGIPVEAYSPLAQGKVMEDATLRDIAAAHHVSPAQIALAWVLTRPMSIALPRTGNKNRLADNLLAAEIVLSAEEVARIDALGTAEGRLVSPETLAPAWD